MSDDFFLAQCAAQIEKVLQVKPPVGIEFCSQARGYLLGEKRSGGNVEQAVCMAAVAILTIPESYLANDDSNLNKLRALNIATGYCTTYVGRWPNGKHSPIIRHTLQEFVEFARAHPTAMAPLQA